MRQRVRSILLILGAGVVGYLAGRTRSVPEIPPPLPGLDFAAIGLEGRRLDVDLQGVTLDQAADWLSKAYGTRIVAEEAPFLREGLTRQSPVWLQRRQADLHEALTMLRTDPEVESIGLFSYVVRGNVIVLTTQDDAASDSVTRMYDLNTLHQRIYGRPMPEPSFDAPIVDGVGGGSPTRVDTTDLAVAPSYDVFVDFVSIFVREGNPGWKEDGGRVGSLREREGYLIVTQQPYVHRRIAQQLNKLASMKPADLAHASSQPAEPIP